MKRLHGIVLTICLGLTIPFASYGQTLEDLRSEVGSLATLMQQLRNELLASGNGGVPQDQVGTVLQRLDGIEARITQLTGQIEEAQHRVNVIAEEAGRRIGDIEFRLTELEGGDPSTGAGPVTLGGGGQTTDPNAGLVVNEQRAFDEAKMQLDAQNFQDAAEKFNNFISTYPGGPLTSEAQYLRGHALAGLQDWGGAARSFLDSFSGSPNGPFAAESLYELSVNLGQLQQVEQACLTLAEISNRYPQKAAEMQPKITSLRQNLSCP